MATIPWILLTALFLTPSSLGNSTPFATKPQKKEFCDAEILAVYKMTLETKWNSTDFPKDFPESEAAWERPYGLIHNSDFFLYRVGEVSPYPVRNYTKNGNSTLLMSMGLEDTNVYDQFEGPQIEEGVGVSNALFLVESEYSLVSFISRMIPSPDWFIGVDGFDLCLDGTWLESAVLALSPMDGGSISGKSFDDVRWPTHPAEPVAVLNRMFPPEPRNPFYYPDRDLPDIATVAFTKVAEYSKVDLWKEVLSDIRTFHEVEMNVPPKFNNADVIKRMVVKPKLKLGVPQEKVTARLITTTTTEKSNIIKFGPMQDKFVELLIQAMNHTSDLAKTHAVQNYLRTEDNKIYSSEKDKATIIRSKLIDAAIDISDLQDFLDANIEEVGMDMDAEGFNTSDPKKKPLVSDKIEIISKPDMVNQKISKPDFVSQKISEPDLASHKIYEPNVVTDKIEVISKIDIGDIMLDNHLRERIKQIDAELSEIEKKKKKKSRKKKNKKKRKSKIKKRHEVPMDNDEIILAVANGELDVGDRHLPRHFKHRLSEAVNSYSVFDGERETRENDDTDSPIDCVVSEWSAWSSCEEPYNIGRRTRIRHVIIAPRNYGNPCPETFQEETCFDDNDNDPNLGWFKF